MLIRVQKADFDLGAEVVRMRRGSTGIGALATFVGLTRDVNDGDDVEGMELEHYPGMTERALEDIVSQAEQRWPLMDVTVIHRVGELKPGDQIVLVAVASRHRRAAFEACEFIMDFLKMRAPLWKKERTPDGANRWVDSRASDDAAAKRWQSSS